MGSSEWIQKDGSVVMAKDIEMVRKQASKDNFMCMFAPDNVSNITARNHKEEELNCIILGGG